MTPEELTAAFATLKQQNDALGARVAVLGTLVSSHAAVIEAHDKQLAALTAPNPIVVKAKGVLGYLWANKSTIAPWLLVLILLVSGGKGCDVSCDWLKPRPDPVVPIPEKGLRVLFVYESSDKGNYPKEQQLILDVPGELRAYLASHCAKGPDGKTPEWRCYDKDAPMQNESELWQKAMKRPRTSLPWIIISTGEGGDGIEGPLPQTVADTMALIQKYGGK